MKRKSRFERWAPVLLAVLLCLTAGCTRQDREAVTSLAQLNQEGRKIGVASDTAEDRLVAQELPQAQIEYFKDEMAAYSAVQQGKIDAFVFNRLTLENAIYNGLEGVRLLDESMGEGNQGAVALSPVSKIPDLEGKVNTFLREIKADGTLEDMAQRWLVRHEETMPEIPAPETAEFHLTVGTTGLNMPFTYYAGTQLAGYDIELARRFAAWLGATLEFKVYDYEGIVAAAQGGDVDCVFANLFITPERQEAVRFSEPTFVGEIGVLVRESGAAAADGKTAYQSLEDFSGKRIGVVTGAIQGPAVEKEIPTATVSYFNTVPDLLAALRLGKIDGFSASDQIIRYLMIENEDLTYLDEPLTQPMDTGAIFPKTEAGAALRAEFNEYLAQARADGVLEELEEIWLGKDESRKTVLELSSLSGENGTLVLGTDTSMIPNSYVKDNTYVGMDIDNVRRFCQARGYALEIMDMSFSGLVDAVVTVKCDFAAGAIAYTEERAQSVDFSDPVFRGYSVIAYLKAAGEPGNAAAKTLEEVRGGQTSEEVSWRDYNGKRLGVLVGPLMEDAAAEFFPDSEIFLYNSYPDCAAALLAGKIDGFLGDEPGMISMHAEEPEIDYIHESLTENNYAFAFRKDDPKSAALREELNEFLARCWADGTMEELADIWLGVEEDRKVVDMSDLAGPNGTIKVVTTSTDMPWSYIKDGKNVGYDMDLVVRFCRDRGYALELGDVDFAGRIPAIQSGRYDFSTDMNVTPEREEQVLFSDPTSHGGIVLAVLSYDLETRETNPVSDGFFSSVAESFEKTFLRENRWQLFLEGVGTTLLITVLSILFGTALGFGVFLLCRGGNPVANAVTRFVVWLVHGMPMVVLLMILYYIIFGNVSISGTAVSIVGFTLVFGAAVYAMVKAGVGAVDSGQTEAAYALGYSSRKAFFRVVLPQALPHFMPAYKGEITGLIKATAIVGYVAVQDLTKMGDIVRSRTYDAFFPLIAVAVIYFILAGVLTFLVKRIEVRIDPRKRKKEKILKGVETHD